MLKHFKYMTAISLATVFFSSGTTTFAASSTAVDTVVLNTDIVGDEEILSDLSWKTKQDKGQWINELKIAEDIDSLILVINNLDKEDPDALPRQEKEKTTSGNAKKKTEKEDITGKSRLSYYTKHGEDGWHEIFSTDCFISGDEINGKEAAYGVYYPEKSFGAKSNPGSLLSYRFLTESDYWTPDPKSEDFGEIYTVLSRAEKPLGGIRMKKLKSLCNYGMILKTENEELGYPALIMNCLQNEKADNTFCGIQIPESYLRMFVQTIDENTRIVITDEYETLREMDY